MVRLADRFPQEAERVDELIAALKARDPHDPEFHQVTNEGD